MKKELLKISIRQSAIYIPNLFLSEEQIKLRDTTSVLVANAIKLGYDFSETLLNGINQISPKHQLDILDFLKEIKGVDKNWTPLVKGWDEPTGETIFDHIITFFSNVFNIKNGTALPCGHTIPDNTFPLERYNGCPFCGTPFEFGEIEYENQGSKLTTLTLWTDKEINQYLTDLLSSKTALDATQRDSLKTLLKELQLPENVTIGMKETAMLVIDSLIENDNEKTAEQYFKNPNDILRYLWFKHTGYLQIVEPKTIIQRKKKNNRHIFWPADKSEKAEKEARNELKLKYTRKECRMIANWLNNLELPVEISCELMHPKRSMWIRFIRALRLAEYSKKKGFEKLAAMIDTFYNEVYDVWQGQVDVNRKKYDAEATFALLKQKPGVFARSLFSNMLWFGPDITIKHFSEICEQIPARLLFTINMYAPIYFSKSGLRSVKPLGGVNKSIPVNRLTNLFGDSELRAMESEVEKLCFEIMKSRFAKEDNNNKTIFIEGVLFKMPVAIGDRSETIQDLPSALMGTKFPVEGDTVRLFLQWGKGLKAQHLDMDLSCKVAYATKTDYCSYSKLVIPGCKHSGDIQQIPNKVGTAEYIDVDLNELSKLKAKYVTFTCNAYTNGSLSPNLVVGWMDSKYPMKISKKNGVAYDPSCVTHQVRIEQSVTKGLVFGILDVEKREITWLEISFSGQIVQNLDIRNVEALLNKLDSKLNIGSLLALKADAQELEIISEQGQADEVYDLQWAKNSAAVTQLLLD